MIYTPLTKRAMKIACKKHEGQMDRSGLPYILHPFHVAESMDNEITTSAALLHDVMEDTDTSSEELLKMGIPREVVELVILLTRSKGEDYDDYINRVISNPNAIKVKLADLEHNMILERLDEVLPEDEIRLEKYIRAKTRLQMALE